jgi:hypothetical protein
VAKRRLHVDLGAVRKTAVPFALGAAGGALIWAASPWLAGESEPWDASSPYYIVGLATAGFLVGLIARRHPFGMYAGVFVGQLLYMVLFLPMGPLSVLAVPLLIIYSVVSLLGFGVAELVGSVRDRFRRAT